MKSSSTGSSEPRDAREPRAAGEERALGRYLAVLLALTVAGLCVAEGLIRAFVLPIIDSRANRVAQVYEAHEPDAVLGDSHLYRSFLRSQRFANLARPGSSPEALEIVAREYYRHLDPGRVIVQASPQLFNAAKQREGAQLHDGWFGLNLGLPFVPYVFEPGISRELAALGDPVQLRRRTETALGRTMTGGLIVTREAAARRALSIRQRREQASKRVRQNRPAGDFLEQAPFAAYTRMVDFLLRRGARVCLAATPVDAAYRSIARAEPGHRAVTRALRKLAQERGIPYVDFRDLGLDLDVDDFTNPDHLTTAAGVRYAERLEAACFGEPGAGGRGDQREAPPTSSASTR